MGLKQKILGLRDMEKLSGNSTKILDDVLGLIDEAFKELDKRAFCYHNNATRLVKFEDIRIVLSGGKKP